MHKIYSVKGHVVVTGFGTSAIIANKICGHFNAGTPSPFMHMGDAIHGDLEMLQQDDIVFPKL